MEYCEQMLSRKFPDKKGIRITDVRQIDDEIVKDVIGNGINIVIEGKQAWLEIIDLEKM